MDWNDLAQQIRAIQTQLKQLQHTIAPLPQTESQSMQISQRFEDLFGQLDKMGSSKIGGQELEGDQTLRASEEKWRALSACSPVGIFTCDVEGRITYTNPRCREMGDFTIEESLGEGFARVIHPEDRDRVVSAWFAQAKAGHPHTDELRVVNRLGEVMWVHVRTAPIVSDLGELMGHTGTVENITNQKQTAE